MAVRRFCTYCGDRMVACINGPAGRHSELYHTSVVADPVERYDTTTVNQLKRRWRRSLVAGVRDLMD